MIITSKAVAYNQQQFESAQRVVARPKRACGAKRGTTVSPFSEREQKRGATHFTELHRIHCAKNTPLYAALSKCGRFYAALLAPRSFAACGFAACTAVSDSGSACKKGLGSVKGVGRTLKLKTSVFTK
ncbi:MAG: hypothetical protein PUA83_08245 [Clostridiales bacterium]|nr:hypothetical protein [Clostridiales bacterium]